MSERKYDPRRPYKVWLSCFNEFPPDERPTFTYRRASADEWDRIADAVDGQATDAKSLSKAVFTVACIGLIGWDKQVDPATGEEVAFDPEKIRSVINTRECVELLELRLRGSDLTVSEKKTSESPA